MKDDKDHGIEGERDGEATISDSVESHPDFNDEFLQMSHDFFKEENPEFYALLKKHGGEIKTVDELIDEDDEE